MRMHLASCVFSLICIALVNGGDWIHMCSSSYYFGDSERNFNDATKRCSELGGYLVEFDSVKEIESLRAIARLSGHSGFWIGARLNHNSGWIWQNKQDPVTVTDWAHDEPNHKHYQNIHEDCVVIFKDKQYHWNDIFCELPFNYICEKDTSQNTGPLVPVLG